MVSFLFLMFLFISDSFLFFLFCFLFVFFGVCDFSWNGMFFFFDSDIFVVLMFMSLFIYGIIVFSEKFPDLIYFTQFLIFVCIMFFCSSSFIVLYIFFELSMFPILCMILGYGFQIEKISSSYYLIFYAAFCSFPFLFCYFTCDFSFLFCYFDFIVSWELMFVLSLTFMMKFPVFFLHLWLPKAHVEAPTSASMLLAGLLLKLGTVGFLRIMKSLSFCHVNFWLFIAFLGMILAAFSCVFQSDAKSLAAYSSIAHMSFLLLSMLFISLSGKLSSLVLMVAHGYTSTLMFYFIGEFYHVLGSRMIYYFNSFMSSSVLFSIFFCVCFLSNSGTPPSLSFLSEFMTISMSFAFIWGSFFLVFVYFFVAFYYSVYLIVSSFMGKEYLFFNVINVYFSYPLIFMCFNVFWFNVLFYSVKFYFYNTI
uniref:NADH-ubiquinone oxidoreductase chain 4 n=1 Tax=Parastrongyloides trichosuri TaxID=131310 RepID=A0A0S3M434_PARTI|nr:NADH dehydrogenase subunit 4 [Parastrongyloides trichosuri]BAT21172.1 NADH dehydrogenase subunit 4 [Parastrongyloides trichosuri]